MIVNLSVKGVPEAWAERLRQRAERNHRSLQGELMSILERAVHEERAAEPRAAEALMPHGAPEPAAGDVLSPAAGAPGGRPLQMQRRGLRSVEEIAAAHRARQAEPWRDLPRAVDILRKDRDARSGP